jgi:hypothetical protein
MTSGPGYVAAEAPPVSNAPAAQGKWWMLPAATAVIGAIVGSFVTSMVRKPPMAETRLLAFDKQDATRLVSGFSSPEGEGTDSFAWCEAKDCVVSLYARAVADRMIAFHADPFSFPNAPQQTVEPFLNGKSLGKVKMDGPVVRVKAPLAAWRDGENQVRLHFGYAEAPKDHDPGTQDGRHLSAAFHWLVVGGR